MPDKKEQVNHQTEIPQNATGKKHKEEMKNNGAFLMIAFILMVVVW